MSWLRRGLYLVGGLVLSGALLVGGALMLLDDAVRYVNKARAQGSPVELQVWGHMLHVWHIFVLNEMEEAMHAFDQIDLFMKEHSAADEAAA